MNDVNVLPAFAKEAVPVCDAFVRFQVQFGGYRPEEDVTFGVVGIDCTDGEPRASTVDGVRFARCDLENSSQIRMRLDETGKFYYEYVPVAESFESYVKFLAYLKLTLEPMNWTFIDRERRATKRFVKFLENRATSIVENVSDAFHSVRASDELVWTEICGNQRLYVRPDLLSGW